MHQTSFPIKNDTQQDVFEPRIPKYAYCADACIWALCMHLSVVNNPNFALMDSTIGPEMFSHRK